MNFVDRNRNHFLYWFKSICKNYLFNPNNIVTPFRLLLRTAYKFIYCCSKLEHSNHILTNRNILIQFKLYLFWYSYPSLLWRWHRYMSLLYSAYINRCFTLMCTDTSIHSLYWILISFSLSTGKVCVPINEKINTVHIQVLGCVCLLRGFDIWRPMIW